MDTLPVCAAGGKFWTGSELYRYRIKFMFETSSMPND